MKQAIEATVGLSVEQIQRTDIEDLDAAIAKRRGIKKVPIIDLPRQRYFSMESVDKKISKI
jgi:hypothetical protein